MKWIFHVCSIHESRNCTAPPVARLQHTALCLPCNCVRSRKCSRHVLVPLGTASVISAGKRFCMCMCSQCSTYPQLPAYTKQPAAMPAATAPVHRTMCMGQSLRHMHTCNMQYEHALRTACLCTRGMLMVQCTVRNPPHVPKACWWTGLLLKLLVVQIDNTQHGTICMRLAHNQAGYQHNHLRNKHGELPPGCA